MLIRASSLTDVTKARLLNGGPLQDASQTGAMGTAPGAAGPPSVSARPPPKQNQYEELFVKLFARMTLRMISAFAGLFSLLVIARDLLGFRATFLRVSFWIHAAINGALFVGVILARIKVIANARSDTTGVPFEGYCNRDQLMLVGVWTAAAYNFGAWYLRSYAGHIYRLFDYGRGRHGPPVLREQYYLLWSMLLMQGALAWIVSNCLRESQRVRLDVKTRKLLPQLRGAMETSDFWRRLVYRSALVYPMLLAMHLLVGWMGFPLFGRFVGGLVDVQQPVRHSFTSLFRLGIFVHAMTLSLLLNLVCFVIQMLLKVYVGRVLRVSAVAADPEECLAIGLCQTAHPFIHLHACAEFSEVVANDAERRRRLFEAVRDDGSVSRAICDWFVREIRQLSGRARDDQLELAALQAVLSDGNGTRDEASSNIPLPDSLHQYRRQTTTLFELLVRRVFGLDGRRSGSDNSSSSSSVAAGLALDSSASHPPIPEVFLRRGPAATTQPVVSTMRENESVSAMLEFAPFLHRSRLGRLLIGKWIATRGGHCVERHAALELTVPAMAAFIVASFDDDDTGQVQLVLARVIEAMVEAKGALCALQRAIQDAPSINPHIIQIEGLLDAAIHAIAAKFGSTLDDLKLSSSCRAALKAGALRTH